MRRKMYAGAPPKDKVAVKEAAREVAKKVPGKKTETDTTAERKRPSAAATKRKIENRQL